MVDEVLILTHTNTYLHELYEQYNPKYMDDIWEEKKEEEKNRMIGFFQSLSLLVLKLKHCSSTVIMQKDVVTIKISDTFK